MADSLNGLLLLLLAAGSGLLIGSFLNVCIYRIPRDISVVLPRSFCPHCDKPVAAFDNLPVVSFLLLRGKCRHCAAPIGWRYPAVELMTGVLFVLVVARYGSTLVSFKWLAFEALLVALFWTDFEVEILPDELTLGGTAFALLITLFVPVPGIIGDLMSSGLSLVWRSYANVAAGAFFLAVPIWLLGKAFGKMLKQEALGMGDVKLLLMMGSFLGLTYGLQAFMLGTVAGALAGLLWMILTHRKAFTARLRFGCFLCTAAALVPLLNDAGSF